MSVMPEPEPYIGECSCGWKSEPWIDSAQLGEEWSSHTGEFSSGSHRLQTHPVAEVMTADVAFIICGPKPAIEFLPGRNDACKECGAPIFVTESSENEVIATGANPRPICNNCGMSRFAEKNVGLTPMERAMIETMGGKNLLKLIETLPLSAIPEAIKGFRAEQ